MSRLHIACVGTLLMSNGAWPAPAQAQQVGVRVVQAWTSGRDLNLPRGAELLVRLPQVPLELAAGRIRHAGERLGHACAGLAPPDCVREPLDVEGSFVSGTVGWRVDVWGSTHLRAMFVPEIGIGRIHGRWTGRESGNALVAATWIVTGGFSAGVHRAALGGGPLGLEVGGRAQWAVPLGREDRCADCYRPYDETLVLAAVQIGLIYAIR